MNDNLIKFFNEISARTPNLKLRYEEKPFKGAMEERFGFDMCYIKTESDGCGLTVSLLKELYEEKLKNKIERAVLGADTETAAPFPLAVLSIKSTNYGSIQDLIYTLFESVFSYISDDRLHVFLPIDTAGDLEESVFALHQSIAEDLYINAMIGVGLLCTNDAELKLCFKTSEDALSFCSQYNRDVIFYHREWLLKLILAIPKETGKEFVETNIKNPDAFVDSETLKTITAFLNCDLNLSQASRLLFIHRNTLSYRLDKIYDDTGLDIRKFEDAMKMKLCLEILGSEHFLQVY